MKARKRFWFKSIAVFAGLNLLTQTFYPTIALALTGGPSQPEMQAFTPIGTTDMVDLSSGSFTYNIPLMDVEGYPINLSYHSGITMDQEASWCGLGWNINPGEINRQMRGIPDDFNGDQVTEKFNLKDNLTFGVSAGVGLKIFGLPSGAGPQGSLNLSAGIFYNNYKGPGVTLGIEPSLATGVSNKGSLTCGLGVNFNSQSGVDISPTIGFSEEAVHAGNYNVDAGVKVGTTYNSRTGVKGLQMSKDLNVGEKATKTESVTDKNGATTTNDVTGEINTGNSSSSCLSFSGPTYIPTIHMPLHNYAVTLDATLGAAIIGIHANMTFSGWFNQQTLAIKSQTLSAYGYMYADQANNNPYALLDFNREKDIPFLPHIANLPITNFTYDLYSINGEGVSGEFRPFRGDVGILYDHENYNTSLSGSLGIELGIGDLAHNGIEANVSTSNTVTDQWKNDNQFASSVGFQSLLRGNINYEPFYIKRIGEKTVNDTSYYNTIGNTNPVYVDLNHSGEKVTAMHVFDNNNHWMTLSGNLLKTRREKRNQCTSLLTAQEANYFALDKKLLSYPLNTSVYSSACDSSRLLDTISRITGPRQPWHTSEIMVTNPDGKRYVYGLPVYNTVQNEATFAVSGQNYTPTTDDNNLVSYSSSDRSTSNSEGLDNYYDEQYLPPYAHSYLLTSILSPDYVDMTGNGVSDDDLGQAVKINYTRLYSQTNPYRWRVPFEANMANNQMGMMSYSKDDKGNIMYGEKEVWYVHSIESKTMIAQFILVPRQDAFGVVNEEGGIDNTKPLQCLQEIRLYSKADLIAHGANAVPIKTVHFVYDYSLCPGTPNSTAAGQGKLTLKQVYFTYGNNTEGSLNSYQFSYNGYNPAFSHSNYDRWGYYKEKTSNPGVSLSNQDFPYTSQNADSTSKYCTAWNMTDINLPSGGHIKVNYQPNDYAYVQNQRAGQMFTVLGVSNTPGSPTNNLYSSGNWNNWIDVKIPVHETNPTNFYNDYLAGINQLYFRFAVEVDARGTGHYEYVSGYSTIGGYQEVNDSVWAINLNEVSSGDLTVGNANPITLATWQYLRLNLPQYAYPGSETDGSIYSMIMGVFGILVDVIRIFTGFDATMYVVGGGQNFIPDHSWIRLNKPTYQKLGGGTRVSEIDIADNWANMANGQSSYTYGQTYNYTTALAVNGQTKTISSGVATYEPLQGGDENPLRTPLPYSQQEMLAPNNEFYTETPLGESLYPSPGVVYGKVTVTNLQHPGTERTSTGKTVNEFYTAYDFPVINKWTDLDNIRVKPNAIASLLSFSTQDFTTASQGFSVEVNDMPGKEKGQEVYDQNGSEISSVHYYYHTDADNTSHLNNDVQVVNPDGSVGMASIGKDIDTYVDMREQETTTEGYGATFNGETFVLFALITLPIIIPSYSSEDTRFRSAVTTKYIYRSGLVDSVVNMKYGSSVTTQNVAYDAETGNVLLTQTHNEFNEPLYDFTYPAHFAYDGMGSEYKNIGFEYNNVTITGGEFINPSESVAAQYFTPGDELEYYNSSGNLVDSTFWITQPQVGGPLSVMDQHGYAVNLSGALVKVIRSGRRNMSSTPIGSVETMNSPIVSGNISINANSNILQSNATVFNDVWQVPITEVPVLKCDSASGPSDSCLADFLDSILVHAQIWASPADNITFGKYVHGCGDSSALYYALTPPEPVGAEGSYPATPWGISKFYAQLGNCTITIRSEDPGYDTIAMYYPPTDYTAGYFRVFGDSIWYSDIGRAYITCQACQTVCENLAIGKPFNPYAIGMLGDWRPEMNYVYYTARTPSLGASASNIWNTGIFGQYSPIWDVPGSSGGTFWPLDTIDKKWTWSSMITKYDSKGNEIEDKDALGRYSGALYGYMQSLPVAVSANAKQEEIAFDGFEDYGFTNSCGNPCYNDHFSFLNSLDYPKVDTTSTTSHTGKYSLEIEAGDSAFATRGINYFSNVLYTTDMYHFYMQNGGGIPLFAPDSGLYLLSAWVKENNCGQTGYPKDSIKVYYAGSSLHYAFHSSGPIIEGWQRFEGKFKVPGNATAIDVVLKAGSNTAYFDDVRIEPFGAEMKTYVYDPFSLRLLGTLDENNYATIYEYSDEGILMRVKKETEKGIMTIKESRSSYIR